MMITLNIDFSNLNVADIRFESNEPSNLLSIFNSNYNTITTSNLDSRDNRLSLLQLIDANINNFNFMIPLITEAPLLFFAVYNTNSIDFNFYNSEIITKGKEVFNFLMWVLQIL